MEKNSNEIYRRSLSSLLSSSSSQLSSSSAHLFHFFIITTVMISLLKSGLYVVEVMDELWSNRVPILSFTSKYPEIYAILCFFAICSPSPQNIQRFTQFFAFLQLVLLHLTISKDLFNSLLFPIYLVTEDLFSLKNKNLWPSHRCKKCNI